ncbi:MAG: methyl-accepting chemotaxis protein [Saccharospirillum sp.]|nr:methyl-accepting chemotaxis protein [Saccharospirillum sp.]
MHKVKPFHSILMRLVVGFSAIFLVVLLAALNSIRNGNSTAERVYILTNHTTPVLTSSQQIELLLVQIAGDFQQILAQQDHESISPLESNLRDRQAALGGLLEESSALVAPLSQAESAVDSIERISDLNQSLASVIDNTLGLHKNSIEQRQAFYALIRDTDNIERQFSPEFETLLFSLDDDYSLATANEFYASFLQGIMTIKDIALAQDAESLSVLIDRFNLWQQSHQTQFFAFTSLAMSYPESRAFMQSTEGYTNQLMEISLGTDSSPGLILLREEILALQSAYEQNLTLFFEQQSAASRPIRTLNQWSTQYNAQTQADIQGQLSQTGRYILIALFCTLAVSISVLLLLLKSLGKPLLTLKTILGALARGNLTEAIDHHSQDEIGELTLAVEQTRQQLGDMVREIKGKAELVQRTAMDNEQLSDTLKSRSIEQSREVDSISTSMVEMSATVKEVATIAQQGMKLTEQSTVEIEQTNEDIDRNLSALNALKESIHSTVERMTHLTDEMKGIETVSSTIESIAEQTNLLALNAAIEAARAGDQGRGFAVVADEVRLLASRTAASTSEIRNTVESLIRAYSSLSSTMEDNRSAVESSHACSLQAVQSIGSFRNRILEINDLNSGIAQTAQEQGTTAEDISHRLVLIADIIKESSSNAVTASEYSQQLGVLANELEGSVERFITEPASPS